jgi:hypothetical protein
MAYGGFCDHYRGDTESARWTAAREYDIAWDLAHLEQQIEFSERTPELKADLVQREQEIRADRAAARPTPKLPPGAAVSMRGLAILRQRDREE